MSKGIITLCGSTKFYKTFQDVNKELTLQGYIVLPIGAVLDKTAEQDNKIFRLKAMLDELHKEKIAMSNAIFVLDVDGYIGKSTKSEIEFAKKHNKKIYYLSERNYKLCE